MAKKIIVANPQESSIGPNGERLFRWIALLENGKEIITWAENKTAALSKISKRGYAVIKIRKAGNPLEDRPKRNPYKSQSQRRKFHAMLERGEISPETVAEFDRESEGLDLPERVNPNKAKYKWLKHDNGEYHYMLITADDRWYIKAIIKPSSKGFIATADGQSALPMKSLKEAKEWAVFVLTHDFDRWKNKLSRQELRDDTSFK